MRVGCRRFYHAAAARECACITPREPPLLLIHIFTPSPSAGAFLAHSPLATPCLSTPAVMSGGGRVEGARHAAYLPPRLPGRKGTCGRGGEVARGSLSTPLECHRLTE